MMFTAKTLILNFPSPSGRVYTKECMEKALQNFNKEKVEITMSNNGNGYVVPSLRDVVGVGTNVRIDGDYLVLDCELFDEKVKEFNLINKNINIRPIGTRVIVDNKIVKEYSLVGFTLVQRNKIELN